MYGKKTLKAKSMMQPHTHCSNYTMRFYGKLKDSSPVLKEAGTQAGSPLLLEAP